MVDGKDEPVAHACSKTKLTTIPTEIEGFGGAATCLGGAIRDPLSGRSLCLSGDARHRRGRSARAVRAETLRGQAAPAAHHHDRRAGLFQLLRQPDRSGGRQGSRNYYASGLSSPSAWSSARLSPRLRATNVTPRAVPEARRYRDCSLGGQHGSRRLRRRDRLLQGAQCAVAGRPAARRCRRATRRPSASIQRLFRHAEVCAD